MIRRVYLTTFILIWGFLSYGRALAQTDIPWPMAGANPQRTSWTSQGMDLNIATLWVKPIPPYVPQHVQVIAAEGKVFVSTAAGLYAFDANTGADLWRYPTALPLGNSPTYANGFLYVGGLDRKMHKISAVDGQGVWTFTADGGFSSNPIVTGGKVYATNRDGALYAINDTTFPTLAWKFPTGNQIRQSPALANNTLYFASNDGYAYAVNTSGTQVWKSVQKLPSKGFFWWPVIHQSDVIFTSTSFGSERNGGDNDHLLCTESSPSDHPIGCSVTNSVTPGKISNSVAGPWVSGMATMDLLQENTTTPPANYGLTYPDYFERYPHYRNALFFNLATGQERPIDIDNDGITDAAPVTWVGDDGTPFPPIVSGYDNTIYFRTLTRAAGGFGSKTVVGWSPDNQFKKYLSLPYSNMSGQSGFWPGDEPVGFAAAGNKIFWNLCCDRFVGGLDLSLPNQDFFSNVDDGAPLRQRRYIISGGLPFGSPLPTNIGMPTNYYQEAVKFFWDPPKPAVFWNENDKVGPTPYNGKLYVILGNALVVLGPGGAGSSAPILPSAPEVTPPPATSQPTNDQLKARLEQEVQEVVSGHLKPSLGYGPNYEGGLVEDHVKHYWHNPADTFMVLTRALPHLSTNLQTSVRTYLQNELVNYSPAKVSHIGFTNGVQRDTFAYPPLGGQYRAADFDVGTFGGWGFPPYNIYVLWKMAENRIGCSSPTCTPATIAQSYLNDLVASGHDLKVPITANKPILSNDYLRAFPNVLNAFIAGYKGHIELKKLTGNVLPPTDPYVVEHNRLLNLRVSQSMVFPNPQEPWTCENECYFESLITHFNFAYLTRELADYLSSHPAPPPQDPNLEMDTMRILQRYQNIAPYWMDAHNGATQGEFTRMPYQQTYSMFQALAMVKRASRDELVKYLDSPIVPIGDLYYIDNLVAVLEAPSGASPTPTPTLTPQQRGDIEPTGGDGDIDINDFIRLLTNFGSTNCGFNLLGTPCLIDIFDFNRLVNNFGKLP